MWTKKTEKGGDLHFQEEIDCIFNFIKICPKKLELNCYSKHTISTNISLNFWRYLTFLNIVSIQELITNELGQGFEKAKPEMKPEEIIFESVFPDLVQPTPLHPCKASQASSQRIGVLCLIMITKVWILGFWILFGEVWTFWPGPYMYFKSLLWIWLEIYNNPVLQQKPHFRFFIYPISQLLLIGSL